MKELAVKCNNNKNELSQISNSMNDQLNHLNNKIKTQLGTADDNILVKFSIIELRNLHIIFINIELICIY